MKIDTHNSQDLGVAVVSTGILSPTRRVQTAAIQTGRTDADTISAATAEVYPVYPARGNLACIGLVGGHFNAHARVSWCLGKLYYAVANR